MRQRPSADRACGIALLAAVGGFWIAWLSTVADPGASYGWTSNMVSDLGRTTCTMWADQWVCAPRHRMFNATLIAAGVAVTWVAATVRHRWGTALTLAIAGFGLGLVVLGAVPSDVDKAVHMVGAVLALPVPGVGLLISGARPDRPWLTGFRRLRVVLGTLCLAVSAGHLLPDTAPFPRGPAEYAAFLAIEAFLLVEGVRLLRVPQSGSPLSNVVTRPRQPPERRRY